MTTTFKPRLLKQILLALFGSFVAFPLVFGVFAWKYYGLLGLLFVFVIGAILSFRLMIQLAVKEYELLSDGIQITQGIIARSHAMLLYSEIQDIKEQQELSSRVFGITTLEITTMAQQYHLLEDIPAKDALIIQKHIFAQQKKHQTVNVHHTTHYCTGTRHMPYKIHPMDRGVIVSAVGFFICLFLTIGAIALGAPFFFGVASFFSTYGMIVFLVIFSSLATEKRFRYSLAPEYLESGMDFINKASIKTPYQKIQNLIVSEGVERAVGLATLVLETAEPERAIDSEGMNFSNTIPSLKRADAFALRDNILMCMGIHDRHTKDLHITFPLSEWRPFKCAVQSTFWLFVLLSFIGLFMLSANNGGSNTMPSFLIPTMIVLLILWFSGKLVYEYLFLRSYAYGDNNELFTFRKGVAFVKTTTLPYTAVQHVIVDQDLFGKLFGLWDVHLATAGSTQLNVHMNGLRHDHAVLLCKRILSRIKK